MSDNDQLKLSVSNGRKAFRPGETIEIEAEWNLSNQPDSVEMRLVWYTAGKGDTEIKVVKSMPQSTPRMAEKRRVSLRLPAEPYSFSGKLVSLIWAIELIAEPNLNSTRLDIVVAPNAREIMLHIDGRNENAI